MRAMYVTYLLLISAGLLFFLVTGLRHA